MNILKKLFKKKQPQIEVTENKEAYSDNRTAEEGELIGRFEVKNSPFTIIQIKDRNECFGTMGQYRITETFDKVYKVEHELNRMTWNQIVSIMLIIAQQTNKTEKQ